MSRIHSFNLGNFKCTVLDDGCINIPLTKDFPNISEDLLKKYALEHGSQGIDFEVGFNYLLIEAGDTTVLVDTARGSGDLINALSKTRYSSDNIDYVVITHGDGDHVGGLSQFPNSKIILPGNAYDLWTKPDSRQKLKDEFEAAPFIKNAPEERRKGALKGRECLGAEIYPNLKDKLQLVGDGQEFLPGIKMIYAPGHRSDHYILMIESQGQKLIHCCDAIRYCFQSSYKIPSAYDSYPDQWKRTVETIFKDKTNSKTLFFGTHLTFPGLASFKSEKLILKTND